MNFNLFYYEVRVCLESQSGMFAKFLSGLIGRDCVKLPGELSLEEPIENRWTAFSLHTVRAIILEILLFNSVCQRGNGL